MDENNTTERIRLFDVAELKFKRACAWRDWQAALSAADAMITCALRDRELSDAAYNFDYASRMLNNPLRRFFGGSAKARAEVKA